VSAEPPALIVEDIRATSGETHRWNDYALELERQALPTVRASAERWAGSLTGLLAVVGLGAVLDGAKRFELVQAPWRGIGEAAFFAAGALAFAAACSAATAAQATSTQVFLGSGAGFRKASDTAVRLALRKLAWSRALTIGAGVLIFVSAGTIWFAPKHSASPTRIDVYGADCSSRSVDTQAKPPPPPPALVVRCLR
jgi:hypothetical protein